MNVQTARQWLGVIADAIALAEQLGVDKIDLSHPDLDRAREMDDAARAELFDAIKAAEAKLAK